MTKNNFNPTWWLYDLPSVEEERQITSILGINNFILGMRLPGNKNGQLLWPFLDINGHISENKKLLIEMLLDKKIVKDWVLN